MRIVGKFNYPGNPDSSKKAFAEYDEFNKTQNIESDFDKMVQSLEKKK
jgi:hypothetical protein